MRGWNRWHRRVDAGMSRATIPVSDAWDICNLDNIASAAENTIRQTPPRARRGRLILHITKILRTFLVGKITIRPLLLQFLILLLPPLLDPESPDAEDDDGHQRHSTYYAAGDGADVRAVRVRTGRGVGDAFHVGACKAVLRHEGADLAGGTCWAGGCLGGTLHAAFEDGAERMLTFWCHVSFSVRSHRMECVSQARTYRETSPSSRMEPARVGLCS